MFHPTSSLSLTSHPTAFLGVPLDLIKSRTGEPSCRTCSFLTFSFPLEVFDSQIPFGLLPIPSPSIGFSMPLRILHTMPLRKTASFISCSSGIRTEEKRGSEKTDVYHRNSPCSPMHTGTSIQESTWKCVSLYSFIYRYLRFPDRERSPYSATFA